MKIAPIATAFLLLSSCVTSGDLQEVADSLARVERTMDDQTATTDDVQKELEQAQADIEAVAKRATERGEGFIDALTDPAIGGVSGLLAVIAAAGLNTYRNANRKARGEPTGRAKAG